MLIWWISNNKVDINKRKERNLFSFLEVLRRVKSNLVYAWLKGPSSGRDSNLLLQIFIQIRIHRPLRNSTILIGLCQSKRSWRLRWYGLTVFELRVFGKVVDGTSDVLSRFTACYVKNMACDRRRRHWKRLVGISSLSEKTANIPTSRMQDEMSDDLIVLDGIQYTRQTLAPGKPHVSHIQNGVEFFMPEVLHLAPTLQYPVPLCIKDYLESKSPVDVYLSRGIKLAVNCIIMIKNHPIRDIKLTVRILYEDKREFEDAERENFLLLYVDDGSCDYDVGISVKVYESEYCRAGLSFSNNWNKIVTISGRSNHQFSGGSSKKYLVADSIEIYAQKGDLTKQIQCWKEILDYRTRVLSIPWVIEDSHFENMRHVSMNISHVEPVIETVQGDDDIKIIDSIVLNKEKWKEKKNVNESGSNMPNDEFIDLTEEDSSIRESSSENVSHMLGNEHDNFIRITRRSKYMIELLKFLLLCEHHIVKCALFLRNIHLDSILRDVAVGEVFNRGLSRTYPLSKTLEEYVEESKNTIVDDTKSELARQGLATFSNRSCNANNLRHLVTSARKLLEAVKKATETMSSRSGEKGPTKFNSAIFLKKYSSRHSSSMSVSVLNELIVWILKDLEKDEIGAGYSWHFQKESCEWFFACSSSDRL